MFMLFLWFGLTLHLLKAPDWFSGVKFFFFQAEDGIRDTSVTGVQTCALPISTPRQVRENRESRERQYGLADYAVRLGWPRERVLVIDEDQGRDGRTAAGRPGFQRDRKSTRLNSSHRCISYAVFCLKKKKTTTQLSPLNVSLRAAAPHFQVPLPFPTGSSTESSQLSPLAAHLCSAAALPQPPLSMTT